MIPSFVVSLFLCLCCFFLSLSYSMPFCLECLWSDFVGWVRGKPTATIHFDKACNAFLYFILYYLQLYYSYGLTHWACGNHCHHFQQNTNCAWNTLQNAIFYGCLYPFFCCVLQSIVKKKNLSYEKSTRNDWPINIPRV